MDRDLKFLQHATEVVNETAAVLREDNDAAARRERLRGFPSASPHADLRPLIRRLAQIPRHSDGRPMRDDEAQS